MFGDHGDRTTQIAIVVATLVCVAVAGLAVVRAIPAHVVWAAYVILVLAVPIQQLALPRADLTTGSNWALWALGWAVAALVYRMPITTAALALGIYWIVGSAMLVVLSPTRHTIAVLGYNIASVALIQALALVFTMFLTRAVHTARTINDAQTEQTALERIERAVAEDVSDRYRGLDATLMPLLRRLRDPRTDPHDPEVRVAAIIEGARLRRLFAQSDTHAHHLVRELQPAIAAAEERGVAVTVDSGTTLPPLADQTWNQAVTLATMALSGASSHARIVVTADSDAVTVSVVGDCSAHARHAIEASLRITPATADDLTWVEIRLPTDRQAPAQ